jgi:hypothetical protein
MVVICDLFCDYKSTGDLQECSTDLCKSMKPIEHPVLAISSMCSARRIGLCNAHALNGT